MAKSILPRSLPLSSLSVSGQDTRRTKRKKIPPKIRLTETPVKNEKKDSAKTSTFGPVFLATGSPIISIRENKYKLKITLTGVQCIASTDRDKKDDYGIQQHIYYKANGKIKRPISKDIRTFKADCDDRIDNGNMYISGGDNLHGEAIKDIVWEGANALLCGGHKNQIHVNQGKDRSLNINNSMTFLISQAEYDDRNAEMIINTTVTEYNSTLDRNIFLFGSNNNNTYN